MSEAALYDAFWKEGEAALRMGRAKADPHLAAPANDRRRGQTLVIRPDAETARRIEAALAPLREIEPEQYFYAPSELHVTFLPLFSGSVDYRRPADLERYRAAIAEALRPVRPFAIDLRGLTATPEAVLVQGFAENDALNHARDLFRERFPASNLPHSLDTRFRATVAHLTVMRFRTAVKNSPALAEQIASLRAIPLGRIEATELEWVENDWYLSTARTEVWGRLPL